ncbi:type IA DNA topoisomerase [Halocola ammonii]
MKLCIAEKPSVAREIATILGANTKKNGYFEGNGYCVSYTYGHLCTLKEPSEYDERWKYWNLNSLPILPHKFGIKVIPKENYQKQFNVLKELIEQADEVINCGDAGQEGELIQRWVLAKAKCKVPLKRLWISSLTEESIRAGFENLKDGSEFDKLYSAGVSRAAGDWLLGINATRLYTLKFGQNRQLLSVGRVQTPTLAMIVERHKEITNFEPQTYWEVKTTYRDVVFNSTKGKYFDKDEAASAAESIKEHDFTITSFKTKKGKEYPPSLFDLTSLQVECNKKYGFSADETLKLIQSLYEGKYVTYPRVDTTYLSEDLYPKIPDTLRGITAYSQYTEPLLKKKIPKTKRVFNDEKVTDHHAIIPTGVQPGNISLREKQVFDIIARRFIAVFYPVCTVSNTTVLGKVEKVDFKATGKQILEPGWRELYPKKKKADKDGKSKKDGPQEMPKFEEGESGPHSPDLQEKQTTPPKYFTEATLLRAMETAGKQVEKEELRELMKENGIGRPSTRANIIETLFKRNYITKVKKRIEATPTGIELIDTIGNDLLKSAELTGVWERKLRLIEKGEFDPQTFREEMQQMVAELTQEVRSAKAKPITAVSATKEPNTKKRKADNSGQPVCPKCKKGEILKGKKAYGCSNFNNGCDFLIPFSIRGKKLPKKQVDRLIEKGSTIKLSGFGKKGENLKGKLVFDDSFNIVFEEENENPIACPDCGGTDFLKGSTAYGCANYKSGCSFKIPFELAPNGLEKVEMTESFVKKAKAFYEK